MPQGNIQRIAGRVEWEGVIKVRVHILASGEIEEVVVLEGSGHESLDEAVIEAIRQSHATPDRRGDEPIDSWKIQPVRIKLPLK